MKNRAALPGEQVEIANQQEAATARILPLATKTVDWTMSFAAE
jgi:hypothetical protein